MTIVIGNDDWRVCAHRHTPTGSLPDLSESAKWQWQPATLPFDAISWLHSSGIGPDPMVGFNDLQYRWVEDVDWILRRSFSISSHDYSADDELQLSINRVDCYFEIFLNGNHLGTGANQFREHIFDIDESVLQEENELLIYIRSARNVNSMLESAYGQLPAGFDAGRVHARRCQSLTGWDWTARLSSVSVLESPLIRPSLPLEITNLHAYVTQLSAVAPGQESVENIHLSVTADINASRKASGSLILRVTENISGEVVAESSESISIKSKPFKYRANLMLPQANLWWSIGIGKQPRYRLELSLSATDRLGKTYDLTTDCVFGIRTLTIDARKDDGGEAFTPLLNGVPVFCRGANWIPVNILPAHAGSDDYRALINRAIGAGMNCLRVWGGGIYETDEFYELCDQAGILVWQDFMFACAAYPTYRGFLDEVEAEAIYQVTRLRNHPCIMLWCGNSENEWLHQTGGLKKGSEQRIIGEAIWSHLIREVVEDKSPGTVYHQSSPYGKNRADFNDQLSGDRHNWEVWSEWQDTDSYLQDAGRFISEFGLQALPVSSSITRFAGADSDINRPELSHHQKMIEGQERIARYISAHYIMPQNLDEWVHTSQKMQAEILRRAVEHWRRHRFQTAGALIWQLHDGYTAVSWSLIDYYRSPKLAWRESRRFFAPVLLSMELTVGDTEASTIPPDLWKEMRPNTADDFPVEGGEIIACQVERPPIQVRFVIINDTSLALTGDLIVEFKKSESDPVIIDTVTVSVEPNGTTMSLTHDIGPGLLADIQDIVVNARLDLSSESQAALETLSESICNTQRAINSSNGAETNQQDWLFDGRAGLSLSLPLVEPKYFNGASHTPAE